MTRRFSSRELTFLRNQIPITHAIESLPLPTRKGDGKHSFACPLCHGFNTAINAKHNLARCFDCRQNYNPIELVMHQLQISFVDSVKWLMQRATNISAADTAISDRRNAQPAPIAKILSKMLPTLPHGKTDTPSLESITQRVSNLESSVRQLNLLIDELRLSQNKK